MDCEKIGKILDDYIDGELDGADARLAADYGRESAPPGFEAAVRMKIEAEKFHRRAARSAPSVPRWAAAAAAFVLVILAGAYLQFFRSTTGIKIRNADKPGGFAAERYKTPETGLPKSTAGENLRATAPSDAKPSEKKAPGAPAVVGKPAAEPPMPAEETVSTAAAQTGFKEDSDSAGGAGGSEKADFNAPRAAVVKTAPETIPMTEEAKEVEKAIDERERRAAATAQRAAAIAAPTAAGETAAGKRELDAKAKSAAQPGEAAPAGLKEAQPVALGGYGARQAPFDMIALRPLNPSDKEYGRLGGAENVFIGDLPGSESLIMSLDNGHAAGAAPAGVSGAAPEVRNVAHAADTFAVESPAAAAQDVCEKIVSEFLAARGAAAAQWQRTGGRVVVRGPFGVLRALRLEIMREYSPGEAAGFAAAEEKALKAGTDAKGKPIYKIADDALAVLEIRFVQK